MGSCRSLSMAISRSELNVGLWRTQASFLGYSESGGSCWEDEFEEDGGMAAKGGCTPGRG